MAERRNRPDAVTATSAIECVVALFCARCETAGEAIVAKNWARFDEYFELQRMAWANLNAMIAKFEAEYDSGALSNQVHSQFQNRFQNSFKNPSMLRLWVDPCHQASQVLAVKIAEAMSEIEAQGRMAGKLKIHLSAFQSASGEFASREAGRFLKSA